MCFVRRSWIHRLGNVHFPNITKDSISLMNFIELLLPRVIPLLSILHLHSCIPGWLPLSSWMTTAHLAFHCQIDSISKCGGRSFPRGIKRNGKEFSLPYKPPNCFLLGWVSSQELQQMPQPKLRELWERGHKWSQCCQTGLDWHWELEVTKAEQ